MDPDALAGRIEAIAGRLAGTDAERRAAQLCALELRAQGRAPRVQTLWLRPQWALPHALHAAVGVAGSVVAASHPVVGAALAGGALLATVFAACGIPLAGLLLPRHATQNVVCESRDPEDWVRLIVTASVDTPRDGLLHRLERRARGPLTPGPVALLVLALTGVLACAGARIAGAEGTLVGAVQLVPSALLILLVGAFLDQALSSARDPAPAGGPAAALALSAALEAKPPRRLAVEVVIAGAGEAGALGLRRLVRARRRTLRAEDVVVLHLGSAPAGRPVRALRRDGRGLPRRLHPRLVELAAEVATIGEARGVSGARVARGAGWPAIALEGEPRALADAAVRLVALIDADLQA